jgi:hypothetical protein
MLEELLIGEQRACDVSRFRHIAHDAIASPPRPATPSLDATKLAVESEHSVASD